MPVAQKSATSVSNGRMGVSPGRLYHAGARRSCGVYSLHGGAMKFSPRVLGFGLFLFPLAGQWISYPTAGVPRTPNGKPDLAAACPRTADGKPDLSGLWIMQPNRNATPNFPGCEPTAEEFA